VSSSASRANTAGVLTIERLSLRFEGCARHFVTAQSQRDVIFYTYTPALQKRATTPNPPRMLAVVATVVSRMGSVSFGSLLNIYVIRHQRNDTQEMAHVEK